MAGNSRKSGAAVSFVALVNDLVGYFPGNGDGAPWLVRPDGSPAGTWREGFPYPERLGKKVYAADKRSLQVELLKLQRSVKESGRKIAVLFEGRDAAGNCVTIRPFTENLNPR